MYLKDPRCLLMLLLGRRMSFLIFANSSFSAEGFVLGGDVNYNVKDGKIGKYSTAVGYSASDYAVALHAFVHQTNFLIIIPLQLGKLQHLLCFVLSSCEARC